MPVLILLSILLALVGHAALWIGLSNRVHATGLSRRVMKSLSAACHVLLVILPIGLFWYAAAEGWFHDQQSLEERFAQNWAYFAPFWLIAVAAIGSWLRRLIRSTRCAAVLENRATVVDVAAKLGRNPLCGVRSRVLALVPGNQILQLSVQELNLALPRLPKELEGLSIAHLSDLHFTGRIGIEFFEEVIGQAAALRADMIVVTGDVIDKIEHLNWLDRTLAKLTAPLGVYFVLGNHDQFTGQGDCIRQALVDIGMIDLGGRFKRLDVSGAEVILAGNELPWFRPPANVSACPPRSADARQLRVLLSHSPDQLAWARRRDFDLMLAGHTHGGQIRLPLVGPLVCPSWHGVDYASGTFDCPPTLMHVSRGISGETPIRLNCPPEISRLVLQTAHLGDSTKKSNRKNPKRVAGNERE